MQCILCKLFILYKRVKRNSNISRLRMYQTLQFNVKSSFHHGCPIVMVFCMYESPFINITYVRISPRIKLVLNILDFHEQLRSNFLTLSESIFDDSLSLFSAGSPCIRNSIRSKFHPVQDSFKRPRTFVTYQN